MNNLNWDYKPSKEATKSWITQVKTQEDVRNWHKMFTPWFNDAQIDLVLQYYDQQLMDEVQILKKSKDQKLLTEFQKLLIDI